VLKQEYGVDVRVHDKDYGREVYIDTLEEARIYLEVKGLNFIADTLEESMSSLAYYKEICIAENHSGYVLEAGYCSDHSFSYRRCYSAIFNG